jgi:AcrR family transcriptional regulator
MVKSSVTPDAPRLRSDAKRNRDALLVAAVKAFTKGADASLEGIAKAAGVGIGTLYRHFPTREALIEAAYRSELAKLSDSAAELLQRHAPDEALRQLMERFIDYMAIKRGMADALRAVVAAGGNPFSQSRALLTEAVARILVAGQSQKQLRTDVDADDVMKMSSIFLTATDDPAQARRLAGIVIDGLRVQPPAPQLPTARTPVARGHGTTRGGSKRSR